MMWTPLHPPKCSSKVVVFSINHRFLSPFLENQLYPSFHFLLHPPLWSRDLHSISPNSSLLSCDPNFPHSSSFLTFWPPLVHSNTTYLLLLVRWYFLLFLLYRFSYLDTDVWITHWNLDVRSLLHQLLDLLLEFSTLNSTSTPPLLSSTRSRPFSPLCFSMFYVPFSHFLASCSYHNFFSAFSNN